MLLCWQSPSSQSYAFSSSHVWMWELNYKESWVLKDWCFWTVVLQKTLENPLDCKEMKPVNPKGNLSWILIGRTDAEALRLWPPNAKNWVTGKDPVAGKDWRREEKGTPEDEMFGWHHWLDGQELDQAPGVGNGQWSLVCCSPWGGKESDMTKQLNWTELNIFHTTAPIVHSILVSYQLHRFVVMIKWKNTGDIPGNCLENVYCYDSCSKGNWFLKFGG